MHGGCSLRVFDVFIESAPGHGDKGTHEPEAGIGCGAEAPFSREGFVAQPQREILLAALVRERRGRRQRSGKVWMLRGSRKRDRGVSARAERERHIRYCGNWDVAEQSKCGIAVLGVNGPGERGAEVIDLAVELVFPLDVIRCGGMRCGDRLRIPRTPHGVPATGSGSLTLVEQF